MKSFSAILTIPTNRSEALPALPYRENPMDQTDIDRMDSAIAKFFDVFKEKRYGSTAVRDSEGTIIGHEWDEIGRSTTYAPKADVPPQLRDAMIRPAPRRHIVYHLGRLAVHRRDTRGTDGLQAVLEDISCDLGHVSEWAVIQACRELRQRPGAWYPTTGEIIREIQAHDVAVKRLFLPENEKKQIASPKHKGQQERSRRFIDRAKWTAQDWEDHIAESEAMVLLWKEHGDDDRADQWEEEAGKRRQEYAAATAGASEAKKPCQTTQNSPEATHGA